MDKNELKSHIESLIGEKNYIGAYGHLKLLSDSDSLRIDLTGKIANAVSDELSALRGQNPERQAYLRAQLAWVCRDVPGLSYLYREQIRSRGEQGFDLLKSIQDLASGRPADAADRVKRGMEDVQESIVSGQASDKIQDLFKDMERNMKNGARQVGDFLDSMIKRGESIRQDGAGESGRKSEDGKEPGIKIEIEKDDDSGPRA